MSHYAGKVRGQLRLFSVFTSNHLHQILRPTDIVLAHNKIVVQCRAGEVGEGGTTVSLSEVVQQLEGLAKTQGLSLTASRSNVESSVLVYNLAVARFQQRHKSSAPFFLPLPSFCQEDFVPPLRAKPSFAPARTSSHTRG